MEQFSISTAYMWAMVILVVFFLLAVVISNMILYKPNNPGTTARRITFWSLCIGSGVIGFVVNFFIGKSITVPTIQSSYYMHSAIATGVALLVFIILGFAVSKMFPNTKVGTWF